MRKCALRFSQGLVPCGREECRSGAPRQRYTRKLSSLLQWSSSVSASCLADCSLVPSKLPKERVQSCAKSPAELQGDSGDSHSSFRSPVFGRFRSFCLCRSQRLFLSFSHSRRVVKSFHINDREVEAAVWQPWMPPCVHGNPWFRELFRRERRDNHFSLRLEPCFTNKPCG